MLSRVAEALYWIGRSIERAENVARFIDVNLHAALDSVSLDSDPWESLVAATGDLELYAARYGKGTRENVIHFLTFDEQNPNSILACLRSARENARSVRETISQEMWEEINRFHVAVNDDEAHRQALVAPHDFFTEIKRASHLFTGVTEGTMSRNEAWHFVRLGRMIERADKTTRILDVKSWLLAPGHPREELKASDVHWSAVLHSASAFGMYRRRHGVIDPVRVVEFLLLDHEFPRAVHYCLIRATDSLHSITGTGPGMFRNRAEQLLGQLRSELGYASVDEILEDGLHEHLDGLQVRLNRLGEAIFETFFSAPQAPVHRVPGAQGLQGVQGVFAGQ